MADGGGTAADQLVRLLWLLPAAADEPLPLAEAAERLGVSQQTVLNDIADVTAREFYHPAGSAEDLRVEVDADRIRVVSHGKFTRPVRLNARESLATHVALRRYAASLDGTARERVLSLAERIGTGLATAEPETLVERFAVEESGEAGGIRLALRRAAAERRRCRVTYVRSGGEETERTLDPYSVVVSHGTWFAVGYCGLREDVRVFRVDRIVDLALTGEEFEIPADYELSDWIEEGRVFRAETTEEVVVRYSGLAAARMRELGPTSPVHADATAADGDVLVTYEVADTAWVVRHVLQQGGEARIVEPERVRREVARAAARLAGTELPAG